MTSCQCSLCNVHMGSQLPDGWGVAPAATPPDAAERSWVCPRCSARMEGIAAGLTRLSTEPAARSRGRASHPLRVLVVDDQELVLRCTARALSDFETVVAVLNPGKALGMLEHDQEFDVVVSDVMMPEMSGPELYMRCHAHSPRTADRFIFASGDPVAARRLLEMAATQVGAARVPPLLAKPIAREVLVAAVFSAAARRVPKSGAYAALQSCSDPARVTKYRG